MSDVLTILSVMGITLLIIIAVLLVILLIFLVVPVFYNAEVGTNNKSTFAYITVKTILNIVTVEIMNELIILKIFGIKIKIKGHDDKKKGLEESDEIEEIYEEDYVPDDASFFRKLKLKSYIFERKVKEKTFKLRKTVNNVNDYKYKMDLLHKIIELIQRVLKLLKPKKSEICVELGTGNAELTGKLMAQIAMLNIKYNNVFVKPNFEKVVLTLNAHAEGSVMPLKLLVLLMQFINSEPVKELKALKRKDTKNA